MDIVSTIADDNPDAAQRLKNEIEAKAEGLPRHPKLYKRSQRVKGMRELVISRNYVMFYRETPALVEIVNLVHTRRQWPPVPKARL